MSAGLGVAQRSVLLASSLAGRKVADLASTTGIQRPVVKQACRTLTRRGLLQRLRIGVYALTTHPAVEVELDKAWGQL